MALVTPHAWTAGDDATSARMQTLTDGITQLQGGTPSSTGTVLDYAVLRQTATQSVNNTTWTSITFTTEDLDAAGGHSTTSNTSQYVVKVAGYVDARGIVAFSANATGQRSVRLAVNGTAVNGSQVDMTNVGGANNTCVLTSATIPVSVGDYVEVQGYQSSGGALSTASSGSVMSRLEVRWVHS